MAKIKKLKFLNMEDKTTEELLTVIQEGFLTAPQSEAVQNLIARLIPNDWTREQYRGGIRPTKHSIVP